MNVPVMAFELVLSCEAVLATVFTAKHLAREVRRVFAMFRSIVTYQISYTLSVEMAVLLEAPVSLRSYGGRILVDDVFSVANYVPVEKPIGEWKTPTAARDRALQLCSLAGLPKW